MERVPDSSSDQGLALPLRKYEKKQKKKKVRCIRESLEGTIYPFFLLFFENITTISLKLILHDFLISTRVKVYPRAICPNCKERFGVMKLASHFQECRATRPKAKNLRDVEDGDDDEGGGSSHGIFGHGHAGY